MKIEKSKQERLEGLEKWVRALRSGYYKQGKNFLTRREENQDYDCCLGVACKLFSKESTHLESDLLDSEINLGLIMYEDSISILPESLWWLTGDSQGIINENETLTSLNDAGRTFTEIADIITETWINPLLLEINEDGKTLDSFT